MLFKNNTLIVIGLALSLLIIAIEVKTTGKQNLQQTVSQGATQNGSTLQRFNGLR